jgi:murein DD-endopeptidase MepM/ murein hydrolase activator NlpD
MEKKFKFSDKSKASKIIYGIVIAILCISTVVIGIVAANSRRENPEEPPVEETPTPDGGSSGGNNNGDENGSGNNTPEKTLSFVSPAVGTVIKSHSATTPVFSTTLEEWRIHTGIDISCDDGAEVCAAEAGVVSRIFNHPMLGKTVEITHNETHKSLYSNLDNLSVSLNVGDEVEAGAVIGKIGDSSVSELADEPHLHFEMVVNGESVNPLDYITEESKSASLGIVSGEKA